MYITNEKGQWVDSEGLWSLMDFITAHYQVGNEIEPLKGDIDYSVLSVDGKLKEGHYRCSFDAIGALEDGTITQDEYDTTNKTLRAISKRAMFKHRYSVINFNSNAEE